MNFDGFSGENLSTASAGNQNAVPVLWLLSFPSRLLLCMYHYDMVDGDGDFDTPGGLFRASQTWMTSNIASGRSLLQRTALTS